MARMSLCQRYTAPKLTSSLFCRTPKLQSLRHSVPRATFFATPMARFASEAAAQPNIVERPYAELTVGAVRETEPGCSRAAMVPEVVALLLKKGFKSVVVEKGIGANADFSDSDYETVGAKIVDRSAALGADVVFALKPLAVADVAQMKEGVTLFGFVYEGKNAALVDALKAKKATVFAMERVPRTLSKAQSFDAMTSQLGLAGYRAVIEAATAYGRPFSGKMTMAGRIPPATVLVVGAAVAGLEAIQTARNLGAQVFATDTRPDAEDQITSAGGKALKPDVASEAGVGGYAKEQSKEYYEAAARMYVNFAKKADVIITTALIPGRPAPRIITEEVLKNMKRGSVVVDMAAEAGGNCVATVPGKVITTQNGVVVVGYSELANRLPAQSSRLYSNNLSKLLLYLTKAPGQDGTGLVVNDAEEVTRCTLMVKAGEYLDLKMAELPPPPPVVDQALAAPPPDPKADEITRIKWATGAAGMMMAVGLSAPAPFVSALAIFSLATAVGYYVVWGVQAALHSPLMSVTNAISGLVIVGGMLLCGGGILPATLQQQLAVAAAGLASINVVGGFRVSQRMLDLFRRPTDPEDCTALWAYPAGAVGAALCLLHIFGCAHIHQVGYLLSAMFCVASLAGLSSMSTARLGCTLGMVGVSWGVLSAGLSLTATLPLSVFVQMAMASAVGSSAGWLIASRISPMDLPQLVAAFHSLVGLAAVLVAVSSHLLEFGAAASGHTDPMHAIRVFATFWGTVIGGITLTGSVVAFLKLDGRLRSGALSYPQRDNVNIVMGVAELACFAWYCASLSLNPLLAGAAISLVQGYHLVDAVGGADMPVCVTVLNSYSGWALVMEGFLLNNLLLTAVGCLIGSSGAILTAIMCIAMNRSIFNVLFGSYADLGGDQATVDGVHKEIQVDDLCTQLAQARSVIIVPGFGLCQARAQYAIAEMTAILRKADVDVKFGVHPVAGRMPGQLNVLLAEASVPYDIVHELEEVNAAMAECDVALVVGANDVVNPAAVEDPKSALAGMPVIQVWRARTCVVMKRSMAVGYAGVQNPLFFKNNNYMLFGDAKKMCEALRDGVKKATAAN